MNQTQLYLLYNHARAIYSSAPTDYNSTYQPGESLWFIAGNSAGGALISGSERMGRFCWYTVQGKRDKGILFITAYRVCQEAANTPGLHTAFRQQYMALRQEGISKPNPRKHILTELNELIRKKRLEGYIPLLMMDTNGNYRSPRGDPDLLEFI